MLKQKVYLPLESLDQLNNLNLDFVLITLVLINFCSNLITLLKPDLNCCNNFSFSSVDKVTTGTYKFVLVILNFPSPVELIITELGDHVNFKIHANFTIN